MPQLYPASFLPFAATSATYIYTLSLHDALPIYTTHDIKIQSGTHLGGLIGQETILVNSHHHQGIRSLPNNLLIAARSLDGLIEAVESPARRFVLGLQWHPERWQDNSSARIMKAFLAACSEVAAPQCADSL